jgi:dihydrofolate synthase/folylpolyglutamate synthase
MPAANSALGAARNAAETASPSSYQVEVLGATIEVDSPLHGAHQHRNIALAIAAAVELATYESLPITPESIAAGIRNTRWPGRQERILVPLSDSGGSAPPLVVVLDVAHNPAGAWVLRAALRSLLNLDGPGAIQPTLIFGCLRDKPIAEMAQILFPIFGRVIFAPIHSPRATPMEDLLAAAEAVGTPAVAAASVADAIELAEAAVSNSTDAGDVVRAIGAAVVVAGSVYLVGEIRALLLARAGVPA